MSLKICFNSEIHKIAKAPSALSELTVVIQKIFAASLPENYQLTYEDSDGDKIVIATPEDYAALKESELANAQKSVKIYVAQALENSGFKFQKEEEKKPQELTEEELKLKNQFKNVFRVLLKENMDVIVSALDGKDLQKVSQVIEEAQSGAPVKEEPKKVQAPAKEEVKEEEPKVEIPKYSYSFVKEISTIPNKPTLKDLVIYKTITLKNDGANEWPKGCFLASTNELQGQTAKLINLAPGKEMSAILIINSPQKGGSHSCKWYVAFKNEKQ